MATGRIPINGTAAIQQTIVDAKGDLIVATGADAVARLAVGTNGHTLVADSVETTGLKWVAPASGGMTLLSSTAMSGSSTITLSSISGSYNNLMVIIRDPESTASAGTVRIKFNNSATANHWWAAVEGVPEASSVSSITNNQSYFDLVKIDTGSQVYSASFTVFDYANTSATKTVSYVSLGQNTFPRYVITSGGVGFQSATAIDRIDVIHSASANFSNGTILLYGVN